MGERAHFKAGCERGTLASPGTCVPGDGPVSPPLGSFCPPARPVLLHTLPPEPSRIRGSGEEEGQGGARRATEGPGDGGAGVGGGWTCCLGSSLGRGFPASGGGVQREGPRGEERAEGREGGRSRRVRDLGEGDLESGALREGAGVEAAAGP